MSGRKELDPKDKRKNVVQVKLSDSEKELLDKSSKNSDLAESEVIRQALMTSIEATFEAKIKDYICNFTVNEALGLIQELTDGIRKVYRRR